MNTYTIPYRETEDDVLENIFKRIKLSDNDIFVDIGCGNGHVLELAAKRYPNVPCVGIEIDDKLVDAARCRVQGYDNVTILHRDLRTMDWSELAYQDGTMYCFLAWTKTYLHEFNFGNFVKEKTVWIVFKHELEHNTYTEKICAHYPYNNVYIYR